jgi:hypothetical protein
LGIMALTPRGCTPIGFICRSFSSKSMPHSSALRIPDLATLTS